MADGTMPEKMGEAFDPMACASAINQQQRELMEDPLVAIADIRRAVEDLRRFDIGSVNWLHYIRTLEQTATRLEAVLENSRKKP